MHMMLRPQLQLTYLELSELQVNFRRALMRLPVKQSSFLHQPQTCRTCVATCANVCRSSIMLATLSVHERWRE